MQSPSAHRTQHRHHANASLAQRALFGTRVASYAAKVQKLSPPHAFNIRTVAESFQCVVLGSKVNLLLMGLLLIPQLPHNDGARFVTCLLSLIPLAERIGFVTEHLCRHTTDAVGGLINATFGNATEVLVSIYALQEGLYRVVQLALLGSILSNLLLVLGLSCFVGGLKWKVQSFKVVSGAVPSSLLLLSVLGLLLPAALKMSGQEDDREDEINFSRFVALILLAMYVAFLVFQLRTHAEEYEEQEGVKPIFSSDDESLAQSPPRRGELRSVSQAPHARGNPEVPSSSSRLRSQSSNIVPKPSENSDEERSYDIESPSGAASEATTASPSAPKTVVYALGKWESILWLCIITKLVSYVGENMVGSIEGFTKQMKINSVFVSAVIIPVMGNAAEHSAAVLFAYKNRMDISVGIAVGSATQIMLCVLPFAVICGYWMDKSLSLFFRGFETAALMASVIIVTSILHGGTTNWLIGFLLIGSYLIVCCGFWVHEMEDLAVAKGLPEGVKFKPHPKL